MIIVELMWFILAKYEKKKRLVSSKADKKDYFDTCCDMSHDFSENDTF